jgi:hypothetical protein
MSLDDHCIITLILCDISKAFDRVIDSKSLFITSSIVYGLGQEYEREVSSANSLVRLKRLSAISLTYNKKSSTHIVNIIQSASQRLCALRKLKYVLNRRYLSRIYLIFIRPMLEYACELWDGCNFLNETPPFKLNGRSLTLRLSDSNSQPVSE